MRTTTSIQAALSGSLRDLFREELAVVRKALRDRGEDEGVAAVGKEMERLFVQAYGMGEAEARALAELGVVVGRDGPSVPQLSVIVERLALQRAIARAGGAERVRPFFAAAARGAREAFAIESSAVLDPATREANIPSLPPLHQQKQGLEDVATSHMFEERGV